eukprot:TRINITY_DN47474_c0_g2_i1.p1 TRINITY_DN47474_c0_g2~~TRINITY_DN47474_c0_g2_i1.p1  ORF type:complete len:371 (-),score=94.79 TRINITY_DN47474_c0_g2_i1:228-1340(-)
MIDRIGELRAAAAAEDQRTRDVEQGQRLSSPPQFSGRLLGPLMRSPPESPAPTAGAARWPQEHTASSSSAKGSRWQSAAQSPLLGGSRLSITSSTATAAEDTPLQRFLGKIEAIRSGPLKDLEVLLDESQELYPRALRAVSATQERDIVSQVERKAEQASAAAARTCQALQELSGEVNAKDASAPSEASLRRQSFAGVTVLFQNALSAYFQAQSAFRQEMETKVSRQLRVAFPEADEAMVRAVVAGRQSAATAIQETLLLQPGTGPLRSSMALEVARERCDELEKLVKVATDLRQAFANVELLVTAQGEVIDDIGRHVAATRDQTKAARDYLELAHAQNERVRWRRCCVIAAAVIVLLIIIVCICFRFAR